MVEERTDGWTRWEPSIARPANSKLTEAIDAFEPPPYGIGKECAQWLKEQSLLDYPHTITWVLCNGGVLEGFFAIASGVLELDLSESRTDDLAKSVKWPCSSIKWLCRRDGDGYDGRPLINQAIVRATEVSRIQGNVALVIEPFGEVTAAILCREHSFLRTATHGQLWLPLYGSNDLLMPSRA